MLNALLVDDEINNLENLEFLIRHDCEGIAVTGKAQSAAEARDWLESHTADVVFLDTAAGHRGECIPAAAAQHRVQV